MHTIVQYYGCLFRAQTGEFDWSRDVQGLILSAISYGSIVTTFAGGYLANRFSAKIVIGVGMGALIVLSLVSPIAAEVDVYLFLVVQLLKGCAGGGHLKFDLTSQKRLCDTQHTYICLTSVTRAKPKEKWNFPLNFRTMCKLSERYSGIFQNY